MIQFWEKCAKIKVFYEKSSILFGSYLETQYFCTRIKKATSRSRAVVARQAHNLEVGGSSPPSATTLKVTFF